MPVKAERIETRAGICIMQRINIALGNSRNRCAEGVKAVARTWASQDSYIWYRLELATMF